jgi:glycosyltransferase involved in cell wall biosynthesis
VRFRNVSHRLAVAARAWTPRGWLPWIRANAGRFDAVHLHDIFSVLSVGAARAATRAGVPYLIQPHGSCALTAERSKPRIKRAFMAAWGRRTLREAGAVAYASELERADLAAAGAPRERLVELPPPLELPQAPPAAGSAAPTVVFLGRLDPIKGVDLLLDAVALARRDVPDLRLELVGPGNGERRRLEAQAARLGLDGVARFRGLVSADEKLRALATADVFCLLSRSEGLPVAAVEAMACGTPVVLSEGCHLPEVDGRAGVVVPGAPAPAAAAITGLLGDPELRRRLGAGALEFAEHFRAERVNAATLDVLSRLASRP